MSTKCSGCGKAIQSLEFLECSGCTETYDLLCLGMDRDTFAKLSQDSKDRWVCPLCVSSRPKGDNTHTPIGSPVGHLNSTYVASDLANTTLDRVNHLRGNRRQMITPPLIRSNSDSENLAQLVSDVRCLREESKEQNKIIALLRDDVLSLKGQLSAAEQAYASKVLVLEKNIELQNNEIAELKESLRVIHTFTNSQEQNNLCNELEIAGVPEAESENLQHVALITATRIGVELTAADIDFVMRAGPKRPLNKDWKPRPIVVKLLRRSKKDEIIQAAKARRNLTSDIIAQGTCNQLYINERLTKANRALFKEARTRTKQHNFRFCWIRNGGIYVRQSEKKPACLIRSIADLDLRVGPAEETVTDATAASS